MTTLLLFVRPRHLFYVMVLKLFYFMISKLKNISNNCWKTLKNYADQSILGWLWRTQKVMVVNSFERWGKIILTSLGYLVCTLVWQIAFWVIVFIRVYILLDPVRNILRLRNRAVPSVVDELNRIGDKGSTLFPWSRNLVSDMMNLEQQGNLPNSAVFAWLQNAKITIPTKFESGM